MTEPHEGSVQVLTPVIMEWDLFEAEGTLDFSVKYEPVPEPVVVLPEVVERGELPKEPVMVPASTPVPGTIVTTQDSPPTVNQNTNPISPPLVDPAPVVPRENLILPEEDF